uniref:Uncharacterized protein n=1 Tax=Janibacter limosus TaxID=53458 RepID=A0AC61U4T0_9MICO|nr:hypothetical protein [Janibacter limosus]
MRAPAAEGAGVGGGQAVPEGSGPGQLQAQRQPAAPGTERHFLGVWAYSFDDPYPAHLFDEAGSRIADCPTFDVRRSTRARRAPTRRRPSASPRSVTAPCRCG